MVTVARLASVSLHTKDLSNQAEFYNDRWGLEAIEQHGREMFFRAEGERHHVLSLHEDGQTGLRSIVFELAPDYDLDKAYEELLEAGIEATAPKSDPGPGIESGLSLLDPDGNVVELVTGVASVSQPYGNRDVKPQDVNHVVLTSSDPKRLEEFYKEKLGFRMTETVTGVISFFACNRNHHSLAIAKAPEGMPDGLNHIAFELTDWEAWCRALYFAGEKKMKRLMGPGRHGPGNNLFCYYHDEEANTMEYTAEVEQVDPSQPPIYDDRAGNLWPTVDGHW